MKKTAKPAEAQRRVTITYNDWVVRWFIMASVTFAVVALLLGVIVATQLAFQGANLHPILSYGRLRPLHTNAAIFAFVGNMMFAGVYYSSQRLMKARLPSDFLAKFHFFGWQAIIVAAAISLPLGITSGKEYAELEWPIDIAIALVWVVFGINFFWMLAKRAEKHLYVGLWFYIATIVTIAILHIVNSLAIPVSAIKGYSLFGGTQDALIQWWYGHNAVAFFLTTPILGIMYYFVPKAANRPVYSYKLSIIHFWALVFLYIWAGPHHLLNTALPDWLQTLGMVFSVMLWAPSWGGMINGLFTLRGAWAQLRRDPVLKFFAAALTFYGMATFEGPLLSIRSVSGLAHYTDWIVGHVHSGALGWNGFMAAGMFYYLVPKLYGTKLKSESSANAHFWLATIGIVLYMVSMWVAGVTQGLMWKATREDGSLTYTFLETVVALRPMYYVRLVGGLMYFVGMIMMVVNLVQTARSGAPVETSVEVVIPEEKKKDPSTRAILLGTPLGLSVVAIVLLVLAGRGDAITGVAFFAFFVAVALGGFIIQRLTATTDHEKSWHRLLEGRALILTVLTVGAVLVGGVVQIVPALMAAPAAGDKTGARPYTALELEGRDIYIREGCSTCHSQMIRPFATETQRYGEASMMADSQYDHPFTWGSKRTGPDLARQGNKNPSAWHYQHFINPPQLSAGSNMPSYAQFETNLVDYKATEGKLRALRSVGVPYTVADVQQAEPAALKQAEKITADLAEQKIKVDPRSEMVAIIAYLQCLGLPGGG
jgi:cytochrome c oxidase cbb3-type subunit I/II